MVRRFLFGKEAHMQEDIEESVESGLHQRISFGKFIKLFYSFTNAIDLHFGVVP